MRSWQGGGRTHFRGEVLALSVLFKRGAARSALLDDVLGALGGKPSTVNVTDAPGERAGVPVKRPYVHYRVSNALICTTCI